MYLRVQDETPLIMTLVWSTLHGFRSCTTYSHVPTAVAALAARAPVAAAATSAAAASAVATSDAAVAVPAGDVGVHLRSGGLILPRRKTFPIGGLTVRIACRGHLAPLRLLWA